MTFKKCLLFKNGKETLKIKLELTLKGPYDDKGIYIHEVFSASGWLYDTTNNHQLINKHVLVAGQCLDEIPEFSKTVKMKQTRDKLKLIYELWKKYHLNNMYADCEHNIHGAVAGEEVILYEYSFKGNFFKLRDKLNFIQQNTLLNHNIKLPTYIKEIKDYYEYGFTSEFPLSHFPKKIRKFYELKTTETKTKGQIEFNEKLTPSGVLGKPCPVCGYKYGTAWNYRPIPSVDLEKIYKLLNISEFEREKTLTLFNNSLEKDRKASK